VTLAIGMVAATLTIISFVAQVWKIVKTRDTRSLSTPTWVLSTIAFAIWVVYGVLLRAAPIIIPNAICLALAASILALKVMPSAKRDAVADKIEGTVTASR
jgi:MtN3 and saliva related transmembrane protein